MYKYLLIEDSGHDASWKMLVPFEAVEKEAAIQLRLSSR